jgi:multisubunit Na+/H+ antiporter MnhC subunit
VRENKAKYYLLDMRTTNAQRALNVRRLKTVLILLQAKGRVRSVKTSGRTPSTPLGPAAQLRAANPIRQMTILIAIVIGGLMTAPGG